VNGSLVAPETDAETLKVLQKCYKVFQDSQQSSNEYLAIDFLFDIQKHFGI
jgi:hypothetical protein